jgi:serine/threonine protein kinase
VLSLVPESLACPTMLGLRRLEDKYKIGAYLASGTYGTVNKATLRRPRPPPSSSSSSSSSSSAAPPTPSASFVVKRVKPNQKEKTKAGGAEVLVTTMATLREIKLLRELDHPNVVCLEEVFIGRAEGGSSSIPESK